MTPRVFRMFKEVPFGRYRILRSSRPGTTYGMRNSKTGYSRAITASALAL